MHENELKHILELIRDKDPAGFDLLYQHYFRFMFSTAWSVLNNADDCYDVIQLVMLRLYILDEALFPAEHQWGWLKTVVRNEALMKLRKEKPSVPLEDGFDLPVHDQRIDDFVDMEQFRALTATLDERRRKVVTMKVLGDMTHKEIAEFLSLPIGTVQWLYSTSIKELRRAMTALAALVLGLGGGTLWQLDRYLRPAEAPGEVGVATVPTPPVLSPWLPVCGGLCLAAAVGLILLFKFSDKVPTKCAVRRIQWSERP